MKASSYEAGGPCQQYQRLQDLDKCEHTARKRTWAIVAVVWLSVCVIVISVTIVLYLLCLSIELSEELYSDKLLSPLPLGDDSTVVSCYYNPPGVNDVKALIPSNINPHLCTHINVAFASIINKEIFLEDSLKKTLLEIMKLKYHNPKLKILLSVGGAGNNSGFSDMVVDHASRKIFIRSIKQVLRTFTLDGIDLDWEFPALHSHRGKLGGREKQHFSQLLREIRMEYNREKSNYVLSIATASPETIVNVAYDVDQINLYVDYVNIMTYDFHYYTTYTPFTGFNSPLYPRPTESLYLATLNINYTVNMYIDKGLDRSKIVVGIPTYGHTFTLVNVNNPNIGSPASGIGSLGSFGFINYPDVCVYLRQHKNVVYVEYDAAARVPYLHWAKEWVSYDNTQSVREKAAFIKELGLRGAMIYSLNADDYEGVCGCHGETRFPLAHSVRNTLAALQQVYTRQSSGLQSVLPGVS